MKYGIGLGLSLAAALVLTTPLRAAEAPASIGAKNAGAAASDTPPTVAPASPGVFTAQKKGANGFHLVIKGRETHQPPADVGFYMAYRASEVTMDAKGNWFTLVESQAKGDTAPP